MVCENCSCSKCVPGLTTEQLEWLKEQPEQSVKELIKSINEEWGLCEFVDHFVDNREFVLNAVGITGQVPSKWSDDEEIVEAAVSADDSFGLKNASERLKNDRDFILKMVGINGWCYEDINTFRDDCEIRRIAEITAPELFM